MELKVDNESIEKIVNEQIRAAVATTLATKSDYLIEQLVRQVMTQKKDSYSRVTIWEDMVDRMIRGAANEAAKEWMEEQKPKIKALVAKKLGAKTKGLIASVADQLVAKFGKGMDVNVWIRPDDD